MKEVIINPLPTLTASLQEAPIPIPADDELLIKVLVAGSNVKDWLHITARKVSMNSGDDAAGIVYGMGKTAAATGEFRVGDRVAAFHPMMKPGGTYAEFTVCPSHTVFIIPANTSFEEAATIPLVTLTAALSLFQRQSIPPPWNPRSPNSPPIPLIIYGASSALGSFAIKLAKAANIHPLIAICGATQSYVSSLLDASAGDALVDYRNGVEEMKAGVEQALKGLAARHALDAISAKGSWIPLAQMLDPHEGQVSVVAGSNSYDEPELPRGVEIKYTYVGSTHSGAYMPTMPKQPEDAESVNGDVDFAFMLLRFVSRLLARGDFEGHPTKVVPGGLDGVGKGLQRLKNGEARGVKYVYRIEDTMSLREEK